MQQTPESPQPPAWAARAKARMKQLGLLQEDLKKPLGVKTRGAVGHYFSGRRALNADQLPALAKALKMSIEEFLFGVTEAGSQTLNEPSATYNLKATLAKETVSIINKLQQYDKAGLLNKNIYSAINAILKMGAKND